MVIDFVIVTLPNPPGSSTLISPPAAVFEIAPANVLQGAVRLQGLRSSPTPETHVRVWACVTCATKTSEADATANRRYFLSMGSPVRNVAYCARRAGWNSRIANRHGPTVSSK